ncbi:sensor histidine kinase [Streptomyces adelaidensis]|uniref:sensor histidine kinase n=1 Tax=Streptomyces adelaidensis TaxID=2796465 RepID=UPI001F1867A9|nr:ATP-binding protein [Streptomyces adelaidensis]
MSWAERRRTDPDARWLAAVVHAAFLLLWCSSFVRFLTRDQGGARTGWVVVLFAVFGLLYALGQLLAPAPGPGSPPSARHLAWLGSVTVVWIVLLVLTPSATWCAMPLLFAGLHTLPPRLAVPLAVVLTALVVGSQVRVAEGTINPNMVAAPPAVAAVATAVFVHLRRQAARQRALIDDLVRTRRDLAATERRAGVLAERQRLAAERVWRTDPDAAHGHIGKAAEITSRSLAEARRFVHDLAPADLAERSLAGALGALAERESGPGLVVEFRLDGTPGRLPERVEAALLRIAQGALANVREHAAATRAAVTLTCLDDQVSLDIADNGRGFDVAGRRPVSATGRGDAGAGPLAAGPGPAADGPGPAAAEPGPTAFASARAAFASARAAFASARAASEAAPGASEASRERGHGLPAMRIRARQSGGTLTVESVPGEGTVVSVAIPLSLVPLSPGPITHTTPKEPVP